MGPDVTNGLPLMSAFEGASSLLLQSGSVQNRADFESFLKCVEKLASGRQRVSDPELRRVSSVW